MLANRIALLKQEDIKTWKKIEETQKRTKEVLALKEWNEKWVNDKLRKRKHQEDSQRRVKNRNAGIRQQRQQEHMKNWQAMQISKHREANWVKKMAQENKMRWDRYMLAVKKENQMKSTIIKKQWQFHQLKQEDMNRWRELDNKRKYEGWMKREDDMKAQKEKEVMELEMLEMELIKNLKNT